MKWPILPGKNFAVDPRVRGNVTVISNKALNKNEVYDLFLGVLECEWCGGDILRVIPSSLYRTVMSKVQAFPMMPVKPRQW